MPKRFWFCSFVVFIFLLQGCVRIPYQHYDAAPMIAGHIYDYDTNKSMENISVGTAKSDSRGYFRLRDSAADFTNGFNISKDFDVVLTDDHFKCRCRTIGPHDQESCHDIYFFLDKNNRSLYYFHNYEYEPSLVCYANSSTQTVIPLETKNEMFIIIDSKDKRYEKMLQKIHFFFTENLKYNLKMNYLDKTIYSRLIFKILHEHTLHIKIDTAFDTYLAYIPKREVYDFFVMHETDFDTSAKSKIEHEEPANTQVRYEEMKLVYKEALNNLKQGW